MNLLSLDADSAYELELAIAGDVNGDGSVNGFDSRLLSDAVSNNAPYSKELDVNRDGVIDGVDISILGSNYGFVTNKAPTISGTTALTHEDLSVEIPLAGLGDDPEGDEVFYQAIDPVNGEVRFAPDGETVVFVPTPGYSGTASFELIGNDGFARSEAATIEIEVSDAPLTSLDFVERNPSLEVGEQFELQVVANFADQEDVLLPGDYLSWSSDDESVARVDDGLVVGLSDGDSILTARRDTFTAVTTTQIGESETPTTEAQFYEDIAEEYGLDVFPKAVSMTPGGIIPIDVTAGQSADRPDLSSYESGTRYFVSNPEIAVMSANGMLLALQEGEVDITVVHGGAEFVIPVKVEAPYLGNTATLDAAGGVLKNEDDYQVAVAPDALSEETTVTIESIEQAQLELPVPEPFSFVGAFSLDIGESGANTPLQFALPAPDNYSENDVFLVLRQGRLPNAETGGWTTSWLIEDLATVEADGMLRTGSETSIMPGSYGGGGTSEYMIVSMTVPQEILDAFASNSSQPEANLNASLQQDTVINSIDNETSSAENSSDFAPSAISQNANQFSNNSSSNNGVYLVDEDSSLSVSTGDGILSNDFGLQGDTLTVTLNSPPDSGVISLNSNGSFTYTPQADFNGLDSFEYKVTDNLGGERIGTATIIVESVNDLPVASNDSYVVNEDNFLVVSAAEGVLANDSDIDNNRLTAIAILK